MANKLFRACTAALLALLWAHAPAYSQAYPARTIRIVALRFGTSWQ